MATEVSPRVWTYDDLLAMPLDEHHRHEILGGEHFALPSPALEHQLVLDDLYFDLSVHVRERRLGRVLTGPTDVKLSEYDVLVPDLLFVARERLGLVQPGTQAVNGPPDLIIEILSPSNRAHDQVRKLARYAAGGVREYWIVDPHTRRVAVHASEEGRFIPVPAGDGGRLSSLVLPEFVIDPATVFASLG